MRRIVFIAVIVSAIMSPASAQIRPTSPREGLQRAVNIYKMGRYEEAYQRFKFLAELYPFDRHNSIFQFMAAKSLYAGGDLDKAQRELERFVAQFPGSSYLGAAHLYLGHIAYSDHEYLKSAIEYIRAFDERAGTGAAEIAGANLKPLLAEELTFEELAYLVENFPQVRAADQMTFYLAKRYYEEARFKRAVKIFEKYFNNFPSGKYISEARKLYVEAKVKADKKIIIGVLAPLTGSYADYGLNLVEGIKLVFDELPQIGFRQLELIIKDTQGSPVITTQAVKELVQDEPVAIIGPLRSESAVGAAIVAAYNQIPLITPTASEEGISGIGDDIYQISPSAEIIADALAEYAVTDLGIRQFGIIAPGDFTGRQVARAFAQKVYQLGGEVLSNTYYEPGQSDFSNQIKPLRDILLMQTEEQLASGSLDSTQYYDSEKEEWLEQEDWRVYLGGLFLPGYPEELAQLVPQTRYHVISTRYLGLDGWDSADLIEKIKRYIDGSVFATDYHPGSEGQAWENFFLKYYDKYKTQPNRISALAFDSANLIKSALENGASTPEDIDSYLRSVENYAGASFVINFKNSDNANNAVSIFEIDDGSISKVK